MAAVVKWSPDQIGDLTGRTALVTGVTRGIGLWRTQHLAAHGAHVVLTCRSAARAGAAVAELRTAVPNGSFEILPPDPR